MADRTERAGAALLIGIGRYLRTEQVCPLRFAARDAEAMADLLVDPDVCAFSHAKVKLLADQSATRDAVAHHLSKWLPEQARGAEIAVIYFAGHGMIHRFGHRDEGYLLPYDADPDDLVTRGVLMTDLARWIEAIDAEAVVVCLDCCHAGKVIPRGRTPAESAARDMRIRPAIFQELTGKGRYLIASCDDGQVSIEAETWGHGLFTYHLLEGLRGAGDRDGDGRVGITELFEYVAEAVHRDADAMGMRQKPWSCAIGPGGVYFSAPRARRDEGRPKTRRSEAVLAAERAWRDRGAKAAISEIERTIDVADVSELISILGLLKSMRDLAGIPLLFRCVAHPSEEVRTPAKNAVHAFRWDEVATAIEDLARRGDAERIGYVLDGLAAFETHREIASLLDRLVTLLKGELRTRAILLLERKEQGLALETVASLFRESGSPYQIQKALGQGLFTAAYLARNESFELDVVVRVLRPEFAQWPQIRAQFLDLGRRSVKLVHHNLIATRDVGAFPVRHVYYIVRHHVDGATLQKLLQAGREFTPDQIVKILRQVLLALAPIHAEGMTHGSVKPSNIFLSKDDRVILGDLALPMTGVSLHLDRLAYDYQYASPETFRQGGALEPRSDFYSLGCVAYELACGTPPFNADNHFELAAKHAGGGVETPSRRNSRLGPAGDALLLRLLAKSSLDRFADITDAIRALDDLDVALRPGAKAAVPQAPLLAEESLIRYTTNDSVISLGVFMTTTTSVEDTQPLGISPDWDRKVEHLERVPTRFGRYVLIRCLGRGGLGAVYLARDETLNRNVAIKLNILGAYADPNAIARFRVEAEAVARLKHPNIVSIYDVGEKDGFSYAVLEYVAGGSLWEGLRDKRWPIEDAVRLVATVAKAVDYAHQHGVIHRDLKPANILLDEEGTPKITDFGLARVVDRSEGDEVPSGAIVGTPAYMAPETIAPELNRISPATDIYALGMILYELLAGRRPFQSHEISDLIDQALKSEPGPPSQWRPGLPRDLDAICLKCLEKDPAQRYITALALADDLERFLDGKPVLAAPPRG
jgi:serine/threonine protein kinase